LNKELNNNKYWESFYSKHIFKLDLQKPSDFANFCLLFIKDKNINSLIEFGCGNGRDTNFFLKKKIKVLAFDKCINAINCTKQNCDKFNNFQSYVLDVFTDKFEDLVVDLSPKAIYARFLLHSMRDEEIEIFIKKCSSSMSLDDLLFFEYRTIKDEKRKKETDKHYRNYLNPNNIIRITKKLNLDCVFHTEGTGLAIWNSDDAYVSRQIFKKSKK